jgi:predicted membrane protein
MGKGIIGLVLAAKALRSISNGLLCASFIPLIKYCHLKTFPSTIGLTVFACVLFAALKSRCITRCKKNPLVGLYLAYLFFLPAFVMNIFNLGNYQVNILFLLIFIFGLYHTDGEDFQFFEEAEL